MQRTRPFLAVALGLAMLGAAYGQDLDKEITGLTDKLGKTLVAKSKKKVAPVDFVDLQGRPTELGRFLAEQLSVELVNVEGISVVDRANIKSILAEHKLTEEGLVNPENAKKLGQFAGVDAILIGTVTPMDNSVVLTVKAVSTETAEVIAAGKASFVKTTEIQQLLNRGVGAPSGIGPAVSASGMSPVQTTSTDPSAITTKDLGPLRVALMNVMPVRGKDRDDNELITGMNCAFEFANLDLAKTISVASNAKAGYDTGVFFRRGSLTDSSGAEWNLVGAKGLSLIACPPTENPSRIVAILKGGRIAENIHSTNPYNKDSSNTWSGDFTPIEPGKSVRVTLNYSFVDDRGRWPSKGVKSVDFFQLDAELVIAMAEPGSKNASYSLVNLLIDRVNVPGADAGK
ncbi:MAG: FlgO family outer membrane protein [Kiritimatiellae bacterium]|nr:FlgO family outer membrane protein [Kiritimatiellia bacterium]